MIAAETGGSSSIECRPELGIIFDFTFPDETPMVARIDRLARSLKDLQVIVAKIREKGAIIAATGQPVNTSTATGKVFFDMLGVSAECETNPRRKRQAEGFVATQKCPGFAETQSERCLLR